MKVKIVKEVKRSDCLWRFACGDVFLFGLSGGWGSYVQKKCNSTIKIHGDLFCQIWPLLTLFCSGPIVQWDQLADMTASKKMSWYESTKHMFLKVVKWCWKSWKGPILMHIYDKQCEIMQKNQWKSSNFQIQCFYKGTVGAMGWKR